MSKPANPRMIGGFVLGAIALIVLAIVYFGGARLFADREKFVLYFPGPVTGLRVGAPVTWQGVPIGQVTDINLLFDRDKLEFHIEVVVEIDTAELIEIHAHTRQPPDALSSLIAKGLRAQLVQQSFVTGQLAVQIGMFPGTPVELLDLNSELQQIPTVPSTFAQIEDAVTRLVARLEELKVDDMVSDLQETMNSIREIVTAPELKQALVNADQLLSDTRRFMEKLSARIDPLADSAQRTLDTSNDAVKEAERTFIEARGALEKAETLLSTTDKVIRPGSPLHFELVNALREVSGAARSLKSLAEILERNPDALLFGRRKPGGQR